jgi:ABC-type dipeptide/oligopeptide/nickel transport system permease component
MRRLAQMLPVALLVSLVVFLLLHIAPGDPVRMMVGPTATESDIERMRSRLGLDAPLPVQYVQWLGQVARGNLGESLRSGEPVMDFLPERFANTVRLTLVSMAVALVLGLAGGIFVASRPGSFQDTSVMVLAVAGLSIPPFWLGLMLIVIFSVHLGWLPAGEGTRGGTSSCLLSPSAWRLLP